MHNEMLAHPAGRQLTVGWTVISGVPAHPVGRHLIKGSGCLAMPYVPARPLGRQLVQLEAGQQPLGCQPTLQAGASLKLQGGDERHIAVSHPAGSRLIEAGLLTLSC